MARAKNERNKQFIKAWKEEGLIDRELQKRFGLSEGGVRGLKARLRKKDPNLYTSRRPELTKKVQVNKQAGKPASQQVSKQEKKRPAKEIYDTATYYINKETKKKIKILAADQDKEISQLVREIFKEYFDKH